MQAIILKTCLLVIAFISFNHKINKSEIIENESIDLFWDASYSMNSKNVEKEFELLDMYFKKKQNTKVNLIIFSDKIIEKINYEIKNSNWSLLKNRLKLVQYDGATNFDKLTATIINSTSNQSLLFSDMINNLSEKIVTFNHKTCIINSSFSANHKLIKNLTENDGGAYVDLNELSLTNSLTLLLTYTGKNKNNLIVKNINERQIYTTTSSIKRSTDKARRTIDDIKGNFVIFGKVYNDFGPISGLSVYLKNNDKGTVTDIDGLYHLKVKNGDILVFSHISFKTKEITVVGKILDIDMNGEINELEEVVVTASAKKSIDYNARKKLSLGYSVTKINRTEFENKLTLAQVLIGRIPGIRMKNGNLSSIRLRETRGLSTASSPPLFVVDKSPISIAAAESININTIKSVEVIKGLHGTSRYGTDARGGVILIETIMRSSLKNSKIKTLENNAAYLIPYKKLKTKEEYYQKYLNQRDSYKDYPSYFIDMYTLFKQKGYGIYADRILSNTVEYDADDYEILKVYAYYLEQTHQYDLAIIIYSKVLALRPRDIQSIRDLALAFNQNKEYEKCAILLDLILSGTFESELPENDAKAIGFTIFKEQNQVVSAHTPLKRNTKYNAYLNPSKSDIRVVINWNHNDTDIDLHIIEPNKKECFIGNPISKIGGEISSDVSGFGPEIYNLKKAIHGEYGIKLGFSRDYISEIENPTFIKVSIFKNYGKSNQTEEIKIFRLNGKNDEFLLTKFVW